MGELPRRARQWLGQRCARLLWRTLEDFGTAHDPHDSDDPHGSGASGAREAVRGDGSGNGHGDAREDAREDGRGRAAAQPGAGGPPPAHPGLPGTAPDTPGAPGAPQAQDAAGVARRQTVVMTSPASKRGARGR